MICDYTTVPPSETDWKKLSSISTVNRCLMIVLNHGYDVQNNGREVTFDETTSKLIYGPEQPLRLTIATTGKKNPGYPDPWDFGAADADYKGKACACGTIISGDAHKCAIYGCRHHSCNCMQCCQKHYEEAHKNMHIQKKEVRASSSRTTAHDDKSDKVINLLRAIDACTWLVDGTANDEAAIGRILEYTHDAMKLLQCKPKIPGAKEDQPDCIDKDTTEEAIELMHAVEECTDAVQETSENKVALRRVRECTGDAMKLLLQRNSLKRKLYSDIAPKIEQDNGLTAATAACQNTSGAASSVCDLSGSDAAESDSKRQRR